MATAPAKSQPLHNFSLSFLKWGGTGSAKTNHHPHPSDHDSEPPRLGSRTSRNNRFAIRPPKHQHSTDETDDEAEHRKTADDAVVAAEEAEEAVQKPWNLRPRKQVTAKNGNSEMQEPVGESNAGMAKSLRVKGDAAMTMMQCGERKKEQKNKNKFWIALSKEEIEEDIFVMTGSRPNRRPKKRPKIVQKQLDSVFPGLWLVGVTAEAYKVEETATKVLS
ncbi:hypothetical protein RIF29_35308 [Crotalaria pallida]|uniref:DUF1639 family protein n=1 Tax=Crotalaria pallida TaxID=3830 RepID=A0AAN9EA63_CROPI